MLDGRWNETEDFLAPLAQARGFDHAGVLFAVRRQRFLELLSGRLRGGGGGGAPDATLNASLNASLFAASQAPAAPAAASPVLQVVAALRAVEAVCESKAAFHSLCYCLTLPAVNDHPDFADWSPHSGRQRAYLAVRRELAKVFPPDGGAAAPAPPPGQLPRLLSQAAAAQVVSRVASDPRLIPVRGAAAARALPRRAAPRRPL